MHNVGVNSDSVKINACMGYLSELAFIETASAIMKAINVRKRVARKQIADAAICSNIPLSPEMTCGRYSYK